MKNTKSALDALSREELGIDPTELGGSAWVAAFTSFALFALGAIVPVVPFLVATGRTATVASAVAAGLGLFAIGAAISLFTGRSVWFSGGRQVLLGLAAAGVTFGVGHLIGVAVAG
jgi:VIT1/CCC1 family predicted Fe2+/Mn2+ transporter